MNHPIRTAAAGLIAAGLALLAPADAPAQASSSANHVGHEVKLELTKTSVLVGEPIYLRLTVTNREQPLRIGNFLTAFHLPEGNDLRIMVQQPGELPYRYTGTEEQGVYTAEESPLERGESDEYIKPIHFDPTQPNGYVFSRPGEYLIGVNLKHTILRDVNKTETALGPVKILVTAPEGPEAEALKLVEGPDMAAALHDSETTDPEIMKKAATLLEKYPNSVYAPLCRFLLGGSKMRVDAGDYSGAISDFAAFLKDYPGHPKTGDAIFNIAFCYDQMGQAETARGWVYFLKDHQPSYRLLRLENPLASKYYYGMREAGAKRRWWHYATPWDFRPPDQ